MTLINTWSFHSVSRLFCTGIWNWCRHLKIHYVIAIHLMRWLTNFYDFRFKSTGTAGIGIYPTKAWLSQLLNFKNAIWTLEERYAIKFFFKLEKNARRWKLDLLLWPRLRDRVPSVSILALPDPRRPERESKSTHKLLMIHFIDSTGMIYMH